MCKRRVDLRLTDYGNSLVSIQNINGMSFRFQGPIERCEDECPVCLEDYEIDQPEVCRLPCVVKFKI